MVSSLADMACRAAIRNVDTIWDIGDLPYSVAMPILREVKNPDQLAEIEASAMQLPHMDETAKLWKAFIRRDIPNWQQKVVEPKDAKMWPKVYRKLKREEDQQRLAAEDVLKKALNKRAVEKESKQANIVHAVIPQGKRLAPPRSTGSSTSNMTNHRSIKGKTGADALKAIRRVTAQASANRQIVRAIPNHELASKRSTIQQAPQRMVSEHARRQGTTPVNPVLIRRPVSSSQAYRHPVFAPRAGVQSAQDHAINLAMKKEREERLAKEERLRRLTGAKPAIPDPISRGASSTPQRNQAAKPLCDRPAGGVPERSQDSPPKSSAPAPARSSLPKRKTSPVLLPNGGGARKRPVTDPLMPNKRAKR